MVDPTNLPSPASGPTLKPLPGEEDVVLVDGTRVSVWRLPPRPAGGGDAAARPYPAPHLLAATDRHAFEPYTVARSADGRTLAVGGDLGLVAILALEPCPGPTACGGCAAARDAARTPPSTPHTPAHLRPAAFATLGGLAAVLDAQMVNGVRFGTVGGTERIVAAVQDRYVYFLGAPPRLAGTRGGPVPGGGGVAAALSVPTLAPPGRAVPPPARTRKLDAHVATADGGDAVLDGRTRTAAAGPLPAPANLALPSPDGGAVAVVGDWDGVLVLRASDPNPYSVRDALALSFGVASPRRLPGGRAGAPRVDVGSQYCAWSPDSSLLAATSDALRAAFVWHVERGTPLLRVEACARPALAAAFAPSLPATLAFAEAARRAWVADLRHGPRALAKLPPVDAGGEGDGGPRALPRVVGFGVTPSGRVLAATRAGLVEWRLLDAVAPSRGGAADAPAGARAAARALLCACAAGPANRPANTAGPWSLPMDVAETVVEAASHPAGAWVGVGAPPRARAPVVRVLAPPGGATYAAVAAMRAPAPAVVAREDGE